MYLYNYYISENILYSVLETMLECLVDDDKEIRMLASKGILTYLNISGQFNEDQCLNSFLCYLGND